MIFNQLLFSTIGRINISTWWNWNEQIKNSINEIANSAIERKNSKITDLVIKYIVKISTFDLYVTTTVYLILIISQFNVLFHILSSKNLFNLALIIYIPPITWCQMMNMWIFWVDFFSNKNCYGHKADNHRILRNWYCSFQYTGHKLSLFDFLFSKNFVDFSQALKTVRQVDDTQHKYIAEHLT